MSLEKSEPQTLDRLAGDWRIAQLKRGHRFSADDLLTAWTAAHALPTAVTLCDIGAGIGSVGLLTLWRLTPTCPSATLTMVEVQPVSHGLAKQTVVHNGLTSRVDAHLGDLRSAPVLDGSRRFQLVTGSPPYLPSDQGIASRHPQKAAARFELHGDVFDYCGAAARILEENGRFVFCHASRDPRPEQAIEAAGLHLIARRDVVFRSDQPPLIALYTCVRSLGHGRVDPSPFVIRDERGLWTDEYLAMRRDMGTVVWNRDPGAGDEP